MQLGQEFLKKQLDAKRERVLTRYRYYEMKNAVPDFGISTPPSLRGMTSIMGWCSKAVDSLADRLQLQGLRNDGFGISEILAANNQDILIDSSILGALIGSCSFFYVYPDADGAPRLSVVDGADATGDVDPTTGMLSEGYAVLERHPVTRRPMVWAYFTPGRTDFDGVDIQPFSVDNPAAYPLLVPMIYRPDARRPFGRSRISRAAMSAVQGAARTVKRSEISAEFYSFPQKYVIGLAPDVEITNRWAAAMSTLFSVSKDADGDKPTVGQFTQQSMSPHVEQLRMFANIFAGESGLTVDDLGFPSDNPASAEAIRAAHANLNLTARRAQRNFASGILNAGLVAASIRDNFPYRRQQLAKTQVIWHPIFEPDSSSLGAIGDAVGKLNTAIPGYIGPDSLYQLTGVRGDSIG